jgi:hypothetical protein
MVHDCGMSSSDRPRLVYCRCAYAQVLPPEVKDEVLRHLGETEAAFDSVADLCEMSARRDPRLASIAAGGTPLKIAACHRRAVLWLFHAAGAPLPEQSTEVVNLRSLSADRACSRLDDPVIDASAP